MEMGKEIRRLRTDRGLTQEALASALHVTAQTVSKWECGTSFPDVQLLPEIAVFFGVSIDRLFAMTPEQELERLENHIAGSGLLAESETRRIEQQLRAIAENPAHAGRALTILTGLFNHQAERYRECAVTVGREAVERSEGSGDAISELANAWNSYIPDWCCRNHHALIEWFSDYCRRNPKNRPALMWLLDNLIDDRRLAEAREWLGKLEQIDGTFRTSMYRCLIAQAAGDREEADRLLRKLEAMEGQDWSWALTVGDLTTRPSPGTAARRRCSPRRSSSTVPRALRTSARSAVTGRELLMPIASSCVCWSRTGASSAARSTPKSSAPSKSCSDQPHNKMGHLLR